MLTWCAAYKIDFHGKCVVGCLQVLPVSLDGMLIVYVGATS